jgi:putative phage-type endonuclease
MTVRTEAEEAAFRAERRRGVGGSDVAAILGLDPYRTAMDVWAEKVGILVGDPDEPEANEAMRWGQLLEPVIVDEVCIRRGWEPREDIVFRGHHPDHEWMRANVDSLVTDEVNTDRGLGVLEAKTTSVWQASEWRDGETPAPALVQTMWYLMVTGLRWAAIAGLIGGQRLEIVDVEPDGELQRMLIDRCGAFWHDHVLPRQPPPATGRDLQVLEAVYDIAADARRSLDEFPPDDVAQVLELVEHYRRLRRLAKTIGQRKDQTQAELAQWLAERGVEVLEFIPASAKKPRPAQLVTWKRAHQMRVDVAAMRVARPEWAKAFEYELDNRVLRVTTRKEL